VAAVRINAVDEYGNVLPYFNDVVSFKAEGPIEIIGPETTALHGGMGGTYVKTTGQHGEARLVISSLYAEDVVIEMKVGGGY
jgi:beta-galactosidase